MQKTSTKGTESIFSQKILVTGSQGYIGKNILEFFKSNKINCYALDLKERSSQTSYKCNITKQVEVERIIKKLKPGLVIHCAAISSLNECENDKELANQTNYLGTKYIVDALKSNCPKSKLVFMSSDYVFEGTKGGYKENSIKKPNTVYGVTKLKAEEYIISKLKNYLICRSANIFGRGGKFFEYVLDRFENNLKTDFYTNTYYTPTYIDYFINSIFELLKNNFNGVIHVCGEQKISRYDFAKLVAECAGFKQKLLTKSKQKKNGLISTDSSLNTSFLKKQFGLKSPTIEQAIHYALKNKIYSPIILSDKRGKLQRVVSAKTIREINYAETKMNNLRGGHYHQYSSETFFFLKGKVKIKLIDLQSRKEKTFIAEKDDIVEIPKNVIHYFETISDSSWVNMLSHEMDLLYPDFVKINQ